MIQENEGRIVCFGVRGIEESRDQYNFELGFRCR